MYDEDIVKKWLTWELGTTEPENLADVYFMLRSKYGSDWYTQVDFKVPEYEEVIKRMERLKNSPLFITIATEEQKQRLKSFRGNF